MKGAHPALVVVLAGVSAALHVGKLPPALPVLRDALGITLLQAGFLLSLVQVAGMTLGLAMGAVADALGPRRTMAIGLAILAGASLLGGFVATPEALLLLRAVEGAGFLLATLPAPGLIRRLVQPERLSRTLGLWGAYMPLGTALALLLGPAVLATAGWPAWWWLLALGSGVAAVAVWTLVPAQADARPPVVAGDGRGRIARTLGARGPWLAALAFAAYSAQWLAVVGFLPTIYAQAGLPAAHAALATALAAGVNMVGNIASGRLLQRGLPGPRLMQCGFTAMAVGALVAFAPWTDAGGASVALSRYCGVLLFSMLGGLVPGTLFALAVRVAPDEGTVSTTVGWMQQWSSLGQFAGPPLVALLAARTSGWDALWWVCVGFALGGFALAAAIARQLAARASPPAAPRDP